MVRLTAYDSISRETVRRRMEENELKPWRKDMWCIPQVDGEFVARMEDVLDMPKSLISPERAALGGTKQRGSRKVLIVGGDR